MEDAIESFTNIFHEEAYISTPRQQQQMTGDNVSVSFEIRELIRNKWELRRIYKITRSPLDKSNLNRATNHLKKKIKRI